MNEIELSDEHCPKCGHEAYERRCYNCEDGIEDHDCFEDTCCCLNPAGQTCGHCGGKGYFCWCRRCGWDLNEKRFLNGHDERTVLELQEDRAASRA